MCSTKIPYKTTLTHLKPSTGQLRRNMTNTENSELDKAIKGVDFWWHSIDLNGITTQGGKSKTWLQNEWLAMDVPDLKGKSVLDIGAWDGYFSFRAEKADAGSVVALDHFVWSMDRAAWGKYQKDCQKDNIKTKPVEKSGCWDPVGLPGKRGFNLAHNVLKSKVTSINRDFMQTSATDIGTFDVVFFLGVLYHMQNPLESLKKLAEFTKEIAIIETHAVEVHGHNQPLAEFYPEKELNGDPTNWWGPNLSGLIGLCKAAGFTRVEVKKGPPKLGGLRTIAKNIARVFNLPWGTRSRHYRAIVHAWK